MVSENDKKKAEELVLEAARLLHRADTEPDQKSQLAQQALILLDDAIALDPSNSRAWNIRGLAKHDLGDHEDAITDYNEAIRLNPTNDKAWNNRGMAKSDLGDHEGAISDLDEAIRLNPTYDKAWNTRGSAKYGLGDYQGAITDYDEAIRLNPKNAAAWNNRGLAKINLGDYHGAITDCDEAIRLNPKSAVAWNNRDLAYYHLNKYDEAINNALEAIKIDPQKESFQNTLKASIIAKSQSELSKQAKENVLQLPQDLETAIDEQKAAHKRSSRLQADLLNVLFLVIICYFAMVFINIDVDFSNPFGSIPIFTILTFIILPFIWALRIVGQNITNARVLEQDYFSRLTVYNSLEFYQSKLGNQANDLYIEYVNSWMHSNTADRMERLNNKKPDAEKTPHEDMVKICQDAVDERLKPTKYKKPK